MDRRLQDNAAKGNIISRSEDPIPTVDVSHNVRGHNGTPISPHTIDLTFYRIDGNDPVEEESNILVAVRVRPMIAREIGLGDFDIINVQDNLIVTLKLFFRKKLTVFLLLRSLWTQ